jgi:protein ImuA
MNRFAASSRLHGLRQRLAALEGREESPAQGLLPLGAPRLDALLGGGLEAHALHELIAQTPHAHASAACLAAHIAAQAAAVQGGEVLWATSAGDLFAPGLARAGLHPERLLVALADSDAAVLAAMEEAMGAAAAVVGEVRRPGAWLRVASRRLQLRCAAKGTLALLLHRVPARARLPTAARTVWGVAPAPSALPSHHPLFAAVGGVGLGPARLSLALLRARGGASAALPRCFLVDIAAGPAGASRSDLPGDSHAPSRLCVVAELAGAAPAAHPQPRARAAS